MFQLNEVVKYEHSKMEGLNHALSLITKIVILGPLIFKMPFFTVSVNPDVRKFWVFIGELYEFNRLPNGYSAAPRIFTNLCSQFSQCWEVKDRFRCFYLDDSLVIGNSSMECKQNIERTWELLVDLGFVINTQKSSCSPSKEFCSLASS